MTQRSGQDGRATPSGQMSGGLSRALSVKFKKLDRSLLTS